MEIHLDSGEILSLSPEQVTAIEGYLAHPNNLVPVYDPITTLTVHVPRWETIDDWIEFHFNNLINGAFGVVPPSNAVPIQNQINTLAEQKRLTLLPIKT